MSCNICGQTYAGLAMDCRCTKYGYSSWTYVPRDMRPWYWRWLPWWPDGPPVRFVWK